MTTNINGTPFADVEAIARKIARETVANMGGTFNAKTGEAVTEFGANDYIVGGAQDETVVNLKSDSFAEQMIEAIAKHIQRIPTNIHGEKHFLLGTWVNDGILYIDSSEVVTGRINARRIAQQRQEIAFYDPQEGISIPSFS